jgi:RHS repeat-associated protein
VRALLRVALYLTLSVAALGARAQSVSVSPSSLFAGQSVTTSWSAIASPSATDWIGVYVPGSGDGAFVTWRYTDGSAASSASFNVPLNTATGSYELRIFSNDGFTRLATSNSLAVTAPPPATLSATPSSLTAGQSLSAAWGSIYTPSATDWIGLYPTGAADTGFVSWQYTDGTAAGNAPFLIPVNAAAGTYELRLFSNDGFTRLATSAGVSVAAAPPVTLSASPASVPTGGSSVSAAWTSIVAPSATDWIGLYNPGDPDTAFISWRYTDGAAASSVPFSIAASVAAGTYQLRLFSNNGFTRLATSAALTVGAPKLYFIEVDHLNTPRLVADSTGTTVWRWDQQEPFGNNVPDENPARLGTFDLPIRLPGQHSDAETGLHYNYFRDYDSSIGRYEESDPIGLRGGVNTYAYAIASPLIETDVAGLAVNVYCRPALVSNSGFFHCFVQVTCPSEGWSKTFSLFATWKLRGQKRMNSLEDETRKATFVGAAKPKACMLDDCGYEKIILNRYESFPSGTVQYGFPAPNSNSFVNGLLGGNLPSGAPSPDLAPGIDIPHPAFPQR